MIERSEQILEQHCKAVEDAKRLGTYNALDRSEQYPLDDPKKMAKAVNQAWSKIHNCEKHLAEKDAKILELKQELKRLRDRFWIVSSVVVAEGLVITFLADQLFSRLK